MKNQQNYCYRTHIENYEQRNLFINNSKKKNIHI